MLFCLKDDPLEMTDCAKDPKHAGALAEHRALLAEYRSAIKPLPEPEGGWDHLGGDKEEEEWDQGEALRDGRGSDLVESLFGL